VDHVYELENRRLYLCVDWRDDMSSFLRDVLRGGVDVVQLRAKLANDEQLRKAARLMLPLCHDFGVPFIVNDSPQLALDVGADGVHVGQDDLGVAQCRQLLGDDAIVGLSTHATVEFDRALEEPATYLSAGPIVPTPTKQGRPGTGVEYAVQCRRRSDRPVFVTGGVNADNVADLVAAGLDHFVVVRALTESPDPYASARELHDSIERALAQR